MNLDGVAAILCGLVAACVFGLFEISSPRRPTWLTLPAYVRGGLLLTGTMFTWRAVNFASIQGVDQPSGHINAEGMMALICLTYTALALTWFAASRVLANHGWDRLRWAAAAERADPERVPVMMTRDQVVETLRASGVRGAGPRGGPDQLHKDPNP